MPINRRAFISQSALLGSSFLFKNNNLETVKKAPFKIRASFFLKVMATNWGFQGSTDDFCAKAKEAGYDGMEVWVPQQEKEQQEWMSAVNKYGLIYGFLAGGGDSDFKKHFAQFQKAVDIAVTLKPLQCA